jgi:hypothetical protein
MENTKQKEDAFGREWWREGLARLPLPMLAFSASYGVYSFACLYVPEWVAVSQAAAFELTYIGLAVTRGLSEQQRKRATAISMGAVVVSILYNSLAGLFHRNPDLLKGLDWYLEAGLALLHGAPLAWVGYLVADLLLHSNEKPAAAVPPVIDVAAAQANLERSIASAAAELPDLVRREVQAVAAVPPQRGRVPAVYAAADGGETAEFESFADLLEETAPIFAGVAVATSQPVRRPFAGSQAATAEPQAETGDHAKNTAGPVEPQVWPAEPPEDRTERKTLIAAMREAELTWPQIAAHFNKPVSTVREWAK